MTDGCGLISLDLVENCPEIVSGSIRSEQDEAPALLQHRLLVEGCVFKGVLNTCATLPTGIVLQRNSMLKVPSDALEVLGEAGRASSAKWQGFASFSVNSTFDANGYGEGARLNPYLILLLLHGAREKGGEEVSMFSLQQRR